MASFGFVRSSRLVDPSVSTYRFQTSSRPVYPCWELPNRPYRKKKKNLFVVPDIRDENVRSSIAFLPAIPNDENPQTRQRVPDIVDQRLWVPLFVYPATTRKVARWTSEWYLMTMPRILHVLECQTEHCARARARLLDR